MEPENEGSKPTENKTPVLPLGIYVFQNNKEGCTLTKTKDAFPHYVQLGNINTPLPDNEEPSD